MFYLYADGKSISQPLEDSLIVFSPKLIVELGKAGSFEFSMPPNNAHYNDMRKLKTIITVNLDETELFRGRVLSHNRNFNNVKKIYAEGDLAYLVDTVQKTERYVGTTHALFRKAIEEHNAQTDPEKRFEVGIIGIEDREIIITGTSEEFEDLETGAFDYRQIAINATSKDRSTTYDYIENNLIEHCGGYLRTRTVGNVTYIDLVGGTGVDASQEIRFGTNVLDLTEEATAEEVFTVLIPIGDENLTIASVNGGSEELVDEEAVELFGRIVKTHVFENVNDPNTLKENGLRFIANHENIPITFTIRAVDMHLVDRDIEEIHVGDSVLVTSSPHNISIRLICTRIEYDLENPANNTYTFGNPRQTLTERYRQDKRKEENDSSGSGGSGGAGKAADDKSQEGLDKFFNAWINVDKEAANIDLGAVYKELKDAKEVLIQQVGIELNAPTGNVNIQTLRTSIDDITGKVQENSAKIELWANDVKSQINAHVGWGEKLENQINAQYAELKLEANKNGESIAELRTIHENRIAALELKSTELEASALMKATYDANRTADLALISDANRSIAELKASFDGKVAGLTTEVNSLKSSVVMKADYDGKIASIEAKATSQGTQIEANADAIKTKASTYTLNTKVATINAELVTINSDIDGVKKLIADEISAVKASIDSAIINRLESYVIKSTVGVYAPYIRADNEMSVGGKPVATQEYVKDTISSYVNDAWIENKGFATKSYVDDRNAWGSSTETGKYWCKVGGSSKLVALGNHTHSTYCTEARVKELIAEASISWSKITGKPTSFYPSSHRHSFKVEFANGHQHNVKVNGTTYNTLGVSVNATHSLSSNTGYYGG